MITEENLLQNGFEAKTFFYQIGGGEDEDDTTIFVKDGIVIFYDYYRKVWRKCLYDDINYIEGLPWDDGEVIESLNEI